MSAASAAHSVCLLDPMRGDKLDRGGRADAGLLQGVLDALRCGT